jgi:hypothetical protein
MSGRYSSTHVIFLITYYSGVAGLAAAALRIITKVSLPEDEKGLNMSFGLRFITFIFRTRVEFKNLLLDWSIHSVDVHSCICIIVTIGICEASLRSTRECHQTSGTDFISNH